MPPSTLDATPENFDALVFEPRGELVVVDFWGDNCPSCEVFARDVPELLAALGDWPVRIVRVDAYTHSTLAQRFSLFGVPTFLLVRDGKVLGKMSQYSGREFWLSVVKEHLPDA
ncbi:MAG: thioredoxin family protein [Myxococcaceae bacterium]